MKSAKVLVAAAAILASGLASADEILKCTRTAPSVAASVGSAAS